MSVDGVKAAIIKFLASPEPNVLCIRGDWGTGKTHTWQELARDQKSVDGGVALNEYAYVSLFGLNSIGELKVQILQNTVVKNQIGDVTTFETLESAVSSMERGLKKGIMQGLSSIFGTRTETVVSAIGLLTHKQIVCIDDIERKGAKLSNGDVLGFISYLREERRCKVVLLLNDMRLDDRKSFDAYLEKVVDINLRFDPTPEEIGRIAIPESDPVSAMVRERAVSLGINNIRVIRKISALAHELAPMLTGYSPLVTETAIRSLTMLGWSHLQPEQAPSIEFLKGFNAYSSLMSDAASNEALTKWRDPLRAYGYSYTSEFDLLLLGGIQNGYFVKAEIDGHAAHLHRTGLREHARLEMRAVWDDFIYSFTTPVGALLDRFYECFQKNAEDITLTEFLNLEKVFRQFGDARSESIVDNYIAANQLDPEAFEVSELLFEEKIPDHIAEKFLAAAVKLRPRMTPEDTLFNLAKNRFETHAQEAAAALSVDEYFSVFKTVEGKRLATIVVALGQYLKDSNPDELSTAIMDKAGAALQRIGAENALNAMRANRTGLVQRLEGKTGTVATMSQDQVFQGVSSLDPEEEIVLEAMPQPQYPDEQPVEELGERTGKQHFDGP